MKEFFPNVLYVSLILFQCASLEKLILREISSSCPLNHELVRSRWILLLGFMIYRENTKFCERQGLNPVGTLLRAWAFGPSR